MRMSSIMRWRNGELARDDAFMALLLWGSEADCLVPQHKQFHGSGYHTNAGSELHYRASGLVRWPKGDSRERLLFEHAR